MTPYVAPIRDSLFVLNDLLAVPRYRELTPFADVDHDLVEALMTEAGRFFADVIAPLNPVSDREGCTLHLNGSVTTPSGFPVAYGQYVEAGWGSLALPTEWGGQGLPHVFATSIEEYSNSACQAFTMYPGLTHGAVALLEACGTPELKEAYLAKLVSGRTLGTMALTEPHCGTDLGLIRTAAKKREDGSYAISGEKIFCSGGDQDLTDNIVHLVLARLADAPQGARGISLFLVPKILPGEARNAVTCGAIEQKMGVHGSATCAMHFDGATGFLLGEENAGLSAMFIMMNAARLSCGNHGLAQAERAYQSACAYALERRQGKAPGKRSQAEGSTDPIIVHPDVRRMLMDARAFTEGFRALVSWTALQIDLAHHAPDDEQRVHSEALVGLLTPVLKAFGTDRGFETTVAMQQVLGGHGYVCDFGMEQFVRDARVAMIYEGANGVQALDLVGRKLLRDGGRAATMFFDLVESDCLLTSDALAGPLAAALGDARASADWLLGNCDKNDATTGAASYAFMQLIGTLALGWMWARIDHVAQKALSGLTGDHDFYRWKRWTALHYARRTLPETAVLRRKVEAGAETLMALPPEAFHLQWR